MKNTRRRFLAATTAASYARILGANDKLRVAGIGVGGRCQYLLRTAKNDLKMDIVAVCDVYEPRRAEARVKIAPQASEHVDYREVLDRKDIDAVFVGSPDHWHVPMAADACLAGKDVYVEKPLTKTIEEGARIERAVAETGRIVQVGYQQRSWEHFQRAKESMGKLGKVTLVLASWYQNYLRVDARKNPLDLTKLDAKRWLGSAPMQQITPVKYYWWRWYWDFGGGHLTDLYSHYVDVIHWYMNQDTPLSAQTMGGRFVFDYLECPETINASYAYPGFQVVYDGTLVCSLEGGAIVFRGDKAMMRISRDGYSIYPEGVIAREKTQYPAPLEAMESKHDGGIDHIQNFLDCVRSRKQPNAPVSVAIAAARAAHIGNMALRNGGRLDWKG